MWGLVLTYLQASQEQKGYPYEISRPPRKTHKQFMLLHGTRWDYAPLILENGLDPVRHQGSISGSLINSQCDPASKKQRCVMSVALLSFASFFETWKLPCRLGQATSSSLVGPLPTNKPCACKQAACSYFLCLTVLLGPPDEQNPFLGATNSGAASAKPCCESAPLPGTTYVP